VTYTESNDPRIRNGYVVEAVTLEVPESVATLVLPTGTTIVDEPGLARPLLTVRKTLGVFAHPPERISIDDIAPEMGIAQLREGSNLLISTFGEFINEGHGGATVKLTATLPPGLKVEFRDELHGGKSLANRVRNKMAESDETESNGKTPTVSFSGAWRKLESDLP
jgi:hypothetical protein